MDEMSSEALLRGTLVASATIATFILLAPRMFKCTIFAFGGNIKI